MAFKLPARWILIACQSPLQDVCDEWLAEHATPLPDYFFERSTPEEQVTRHSRPPDGFVPCQHCCLTICLPIASATRSPPTPPPSRR